MIGWHNWVLLTIESLSGLCGWVCSTLSKLYFSVSMHTFRISDLQLDRTVMVNNK